MVRLGGGTSMARRGKGAPWARAGTAGMAEPLLPNRAHPAVYTPDVQKCSTRAQRHPHLEELLPAGPLPGAGLRGQSVAECALSHSSFEPLPTKRIWFSFQAGADTTSSVSPPLTSEADESFPRPVPGGVRLSPTGTPSSGCPAWRPVNV